ncbi:MAG: tRNA 2-thiouridine(34) synthase MnmA [Spirochaetales bacterium]|uniref:tRNA-uridine 2-sulfurtransferase n=1 Tax=Candidatus Thalassospirochaeta sargassi TaxID=3119039 RepID=A0AAJ1IHL4_9SPIO|nr:tRNA 2-thiouridine(34) synthase MnmA [Spirochaetales bacterium]
MITTIAMSGGVDSSAAAWLLKNDPVFQAEYPDNKLLGVTHWWDELRLSSPGLQERAASVCSRLDIPYRVFDLGGDFRSKVMDDFASSYTRGETPNPCVRCNERIRFREFYSLCHDEAGRFADGENLPFADKDFRFCTGHYVRTEVRNGRTFLKKAVDPTKDQSYMLYRIPAEVLEHCIFPLGSYTKDRIKSIAAEHGFFGTAIKESQDICFIDDDYISFLKRHLEPSALKRLDKPGRIFDMEGNLLGPSRGFLHYTIGQRKGLGLGDGPWYVTGVSAEDNIVRVGRREQLGVKRFGVKELNWFIPEADSVLAKGLECRVQVRYNSTEYSSRCTSSAEGAVVELEVPAVATPGQSAVFYDGDLVIGGGIICRLE